MADEVENYEEPDSHLEDRTELNQQTPKRDRLLQWMEISVSEPEKRTSSSGVKMQDSYVTYLVETKVIDESHPDYGSAATSIWRRYSEFELLRNYLEVTYSAVIVPPLPEKKVTHTWQKLSTDRFDTDFIERRRVGLENFLLRVGSHSQLCRDSMFIAFLKQDDGWKEAVYGTDFQAKADSKLRAMSASYRLQKPDRRFEELKNYSNEIQKQIFDILKIRARLVDRVYGIHKLHANYSRELTDWAAIEKNMADGLHGAGIGMEVYAGSIDVLLEDEEQFAEQLKEYYAFGDSLRSVCRKEELLQLDLEKAEDQLSSRAAYRQQLMQGKVSAFSLSGMRSKLFGGDTPEQREVKLKQLDEEIHEAEERVRVATVEAQDFVELALRDVERFKRQKVKDLKDVFTNYAIMQIERCKKGIAVWQNTRESFLKM